MFVCSYFIWFFFSQTSQECHALIWNVCCVWLMENRTAIFLEICTINMKTMTNSSGIFPVWIQIWFNPPPLPPPATNLTLAICWIYIQKCPTDSNRTVTMNANGFRQLFCFGSHFDHFGGSRTCFFDKHGKVFEMRFSGHFTNCVLILCLGALVNNAWFGLKFEVDEKVLDSCQDLWLQFLFPCACCHVATYN